MKIRITHLLLATIVGIGVFVSYQKDAIVILQPIKETAIIRSVADAKNEVLNNKDQNQETFKTKKRLNNLNKWYNPLT